MLKLYPPRARPSQLGNDQDLWGFTTSTTANVVALDGPNTKRYRWNSCITTFIGRLSVLVYRLAVPLVLLTVVTSTLNLLLFVNHQHYHQHQHANRNFFSAQRRHNKIPLPGPDIKVSAIVMNHDRPYLLLGSTLLWTLASHPSIAKVFVLHSNPETAFDNQGLKDVGALEDVHLQKLNHIDVHEKDRELGLALRFHYCAETADTDLVVIVDDDMELDLTGVSELILEMEKDPKRIVGHYGRAFDRWDALFGEKNGYSTTTVYGAVEVVLTKIMILERRICREFAKYRNIVDDLVRESAPKWNGEDIFVNLVANHVYGVPPDGPYRNYAIPDFPVWEAAETQFWNDKSVSGNRDQTTLRKDGLELLQQNIQKAKAHTKHRGRLWQTAKRRLSKIPRDTERR